MSQSPNQHGNKRVEFASTSLETIYPDAPEAPSPPQQTWDTETDHILSYFLSGDGAHHLASTSSTDFETMATSSADRNHHAAGDHESPAPSWNMMPPPTPNVQFYSHASKPQRSSSHPAASSSDSPLAGSTSQSSSSSSLSSMAATLVSGVVNPNMLPNHFMFAGPSSMNHNNNAESPISPAAMIGNAQENLLLPQSEQQLPTAIREPHSSSNGTNMGPPEPRRQQPANWPQPILPYAHAAFHMNPQLLYTVATLNRPTVPETAEKRAKRLERNRVSARKSRRKKKERLETLGAQVNDLHIELEAERRKQIDCMVPHFEQMKVQMTAETMDTVIQLTEPNNFLHRAILDFQYTQLKNLTMAPYQRFLMWLLLQPPSYFRAAKEAQNKPLQKISSKQIGEQLSSTQKTQIHDAFTAWPLFCFELKFSVDQEDRFVSAITNYKDSTIKADRIQMAVDTTDRLSKAVGGLSHLVAKRQRQSCVLTFEQRQKLRQYAQDRRRESAETPRPISMELADICRSLESVLRISTGEC